MANTYTLTEGQKIRLKSKIITGAENYKRYLENKCFLIITEDGTKEVVRFFQQDFKHLTGIVSDLAELSFYNNCVNKIMSTGNIKTLQKYNWSTLKSKAVRIEQIHELLYRDTEKTLLLNQLVTNTQIFPVAIRNDSLNTCIAFSGTINKARSLRKATTSHDTVKELKIIAILGKKNGEVYYDECVYIKDLREILRVVPDLLKNVSINIQVRLAGKRYCLRKKPDIFNYRKIPFCFRGNTYSAKRKRIGNGRHYYLTKRHIR